MAWLLNESPAQILSQLSSFASSTNVAGQLTTTMLALQLIVRQLNSFPLPYADAFPDIIRDTCAFNRCHPLLQILKPIRTTGDGNCMYNALSLTLTGAEHFTHLIRLCAYAMVKYKHPYVEFIDYSYVAIMLWISNYEVLSFLGQSTTHRPRLSDVVHNHLLGGDFLWHRVSLSCWPHLCQPHPVYIRSHLSNVIKHVECLSIVKHTKWLYIYSNIVQQMLYLYNSVAAQYSWSPTFTSHSSRHVSIKWSHMILWSSC